jgi:hypothetical protein
MRTGRFLLLLAVVAACASSSTSSTPAPQMSRIAGTGGGSGAALTMSGPEAGSTHTLTADVDRVWRGLPAVFDSIGINVTELDPARHSMGNSEFKVHGRLKNVPLSRYIDCGNSTQIGPNADAYDVVLTLLAEVRVAGPGATTIHTTFGARARPATFAQEYSQCSSKGVLEARFYDLIDAKVRH